MNLLHSNWNASRIAFIAPGILAISLALCVPAAAQLSPSEPDPLARIREAAKSNAAACSATGETLCEQVAPKIIANAQGDSPLAENLRRLSSAEKGHKTPPSKEAARLDWARAAYKAAGIDAHIEKNPNPNGAPGEQQSVVAEIRGRENPDDWVLLGARLGSKERGPAAIDYSCDAATVIEAARDISLTGVHPRRSIRFVLFAGGTQEMTGSWAYVRAHRSELDHARAAIMIRSDCREVKGYALNGRPDIEPGLKEAMKPIESFKADHLVPGSVLGGDAFDFLLEGVPALTAFPVQTTVSIDAPGPPRLPLDLADIKRNAAVVAVTAFGIAERSEPVGPRQSRTEIESVLKTWGLDAQMKDTGVWPLWESGERGRTP